ncbi:MAG: SAM-dependent methyltransferase [Rhizobiaceae bacterium]|nr:SAM-dependent methyltransferase [Rhizobiaceae bacterium]
MAEDPIDDITEFNRRSWNASRYSAWKSRFGSAEAEAARIAGNPKRVLRRLSPHIGEVIGKRICHVQGSHGRIAVALSLLGAKAVVIDFSEQNRRFALDLAAAAGVTIDYILSDFMDAGNNDQVGRFDLLILELGVLHYHQDLDGFFTVARELATDDCVLILNEFHPVQRKLFWNEGPRDYFETKLVEADVPNPDPTKTSLGKCRYRFWTLGDIVTAVVHAGFTIVKLDEHPDLADSTIPGSFTLVARA